LVGESFVPNQKTISCEVKVRRDKTLIVGAIVVVVAAVVAP
jgi:hypothetical protein